MFKNFFFVPAVLCAIGFSVLFGLQSAQAQTDNVKKPSQPDPFILPEGAKPDELVQFVKTTLENNKIDPSLPKADLLKAAEKQSRFLIAAAKQIIGQTPGEKELKEAYMMKFQGLEHLARTNDKEAIYDLEKHLDEMDRTFPGSREAKIARVMDLERQLGFFMQLNPSEESFAKLKKNVMKLIKQEPVGFPPTLPALLVQISMMAEQRLNRIGLVKSTAEDLMLMLKESNNPELLKSLEAVEAMTRIHFMSGKELKLEGVKLDGENFDLKSLRGKVVLVDFFASWCGPCLAEIPKMLEMYEKYREKGFEIVGVGILDETDNIKKVVEEKKIPWTVVSDKLTISKGMSGIAEYYGINTIPVMFLVDKKGIVVETEARGEKLEDSLKKLFDK